MHRRLWLSVAMLAAGASLLIAASFASAAGSSAASHAKKGGTWKLAVVGPGDTMDPQVTYNTLTWALEYATAAKLLNYPDRSGPAGARLVPEVASRYTVSKSGKKYTFYLRKNFKFADGKKVTAKSFTYAIKRTLAKKIQSPGASFITDPAATFVKSYKAKGKYKLVIRLKRASGIFLAEISMPFFQATSKKVPMKPVGSIKGAKQVPSAGPYTIVFHDSNQQTSLKQNKYWKKGTPGHHRPRNLKGYNAIYNQNTETAYLQTLKNQFDEGPIPPDQVSSVAKRFHKNKGRFWVKPTVCTGMIPFDTAGGVFKGNSALRRAMNYAFNRRNYANAPGPFAADPWDHILPPGMPGYFSKAIYPRKGSKYSKARSLAKGHFGNHKLTVWFRSSGITGPKQKQLINRDLRFLGYSQGQLTFKGFPGTDIYDAVGKKSNIGKFDMALSVGWCQDYPDPYDFVNKLLSPLGIQGANGDNWAFFNNKKWNKKMNKAARKVGDARVTAYRKLDKGLTAGPAPWGSMRTYNNLYLFSKRVNPKCLVYQGVYTDWSINAECLK
jgi:peptide/nickel transport system substrate-binding protein